MAADIRDILEVDRAANPLGIEKIKKKVKRPEGMAREVYALLCIDKDTPTLIPTDTGINIVIFFSYNISSSLCFEAYGS